MSIDAHSRLKHELKALAVAALYFGCWIGALLMIKSLVLAEYKIAFSGWTKAIVGALILSKVVLVLEHVSLGKWEKHQPGWAHVMIRSGLYSFGVLIVLLLERGFEGRHAHGGFSEAIAAGIHGADAAHVWANTVCVGGALLGYNFLCVLRRNLGEGALLRMLSKPLPLVTSSHRSG